MSWTWLWALILLGFVVIFGISEVAALRSEAPAANHSHTLTATVRTWIGIDPQAPRRFVLVPLAALLFAWLPIHILTPWL